MNTSEPTTGEIVRALREDCSLLDDNTDKFVAADRLESQERSIEEAAKLNEKQANTIASLTARAESAERERDAAVEEMRDCCQFCVGYEKEENEPPCDTCFNARTFEPNDFERTKNWQWRGLQPQDGGAE